MEDEKSAQVKKWFTYFTELDNDQVRPDLKGADRDKEILTRVRELLQHYATMHMAMIAEFEAIGDHARKPEECSHLMELSKQASVSLLPMTYWFASKRECIPDDMRRVLAATLLDAHRYKTQLIEAKDMIPLMEYAKDQAQVGLLAI